MNHIVIFGAGGQAKVVADIVEKQGEYRIAGLIDTYKAKGTRVYGYEVLGDESCLADCGDSICGGIIAIGDNWVRSKVAGSIRALAPGFRFVTAVHPSASIARGVRLGEGTVVMPGSVINSDTTIGEHCIINTNASVDHDCIVGSFVSIAPNAAIGGEARIGDYTAISLGASVIHAVRIGEHTVIGAGATVVSDIASGVVAYGLPAKAVRQRSVGDRYL